MAQVQASLQQFVAATAGVLHMCTQNILELFAMLCVKTLVSLSSIVGHLLVLYAALGTTASYIGDPDVTRTHKFMWAGMHIKSLL